MSQKYSINKKCLPPQSSTNDNQNNYSSNGDTNTGKWNHLLNETSQNVEQIKSSSSTTSLNVIDKDKQQQQKQQQHQVEINQGKLNEHSNESKSSPSSLHTVIIDCTSMAFIDSAGVDTLAEVSITFVSLVLVMI